MGVYKLVRSLLPSRCGAHRLYRELGWVRI